MIFVVYPNVDIGKRDYAAFKAEVARCGRDPEHVKITQLDQYRRGRDQSRG